MRIVVDTNIVFSAILNTNSKLARIILQPHRKINFYSTEQLKREIEEHKSKTKTLTDYSDSELERIISLYTRRIRFINIKLISKKAYQMAEKLTFDIDIDDTEFVALTEHLRGKLWSGDKELQTGLSRKGWNKFITSNEIFESTIRKK